MNEDAVYAAARRVLDVGLAADGSAFTFGRAVWTAQAADQLYARFVQQPDAGRGSFVRKLQGQLAGASPTAVQLMGELIYLHLLLPREIGGPAKRAVISGALSLLPDPVDIPADLDAVLDTGVVRAGTAYLTQRDRQLAWLVRLVRAWKHLSADRRRAALGDPWEFRGVLDGLPINSAYSQRNILLNLAFPDTFPAVASRRHKKLIVDAFADELPHRTGDVDRDLARLRTVLSARDGTPVHFYQPPWVDRWRRQAAPTGDGTGRRGWLVRGAKVHGHNLVGQWLAEGFCSIAYPGVPELSPGLSKVELDQRLREALPDFSPSQRGLHVGVLDRFLNRMSIGDVVVTVDGARVHVGTVAGPATWLDTPGGRSNRRRTVSWVDPDAPLTRDELSAGARNKLSGQLTVSDLGSYVAEFAALADLDDPPAVQDAIDPAAVAGAALPEVAGADLPEVAGAELPEPTDELAAELLIDREWLSETVDLLREKKQIVLYGPPGTGKTYLAQALAQFLTGQADDAYRLVQFHPSYSYEDFFEGFRPRATADGGLGFALEPGPLRQLVAQAKDDPSQVHLLIIDEINRANLAKVFGELYFLLEYRDRGIQLQYSPTEDFALPPNVYLIGTMNTADRSIALVDAAMRRRFYFQPLFPGERPLDGLLRAWLTKHDLPADRADLLDELNRVIGDRDAAVGPSYLMTTRAATDKGLARIWRNAILPLLEERHLGDGVDVDLRYGLDALRRRLEQQTAPTGVPPAGEQTGDPAQWH
ncbi:AAA family ATPase [Micromonospora rifamycinica]|uniref:AAA family ATPase n=1 Tax=Micromonospora rifamycinica TaxID=291594 RepID=UPI0033E60A43